MINIDHKVPISVLSKMNTGQMLSLFSRIHHPALLGCCFMLLKTTGTFARLCVANEFAQAEASKGPQVDSMLHIQRAPNPCASVRVFSVFRG